MTSVVRFFRAVGLAHEPGRPPARRMLSRPSVCRAGKAPSLPHDAGSVPASHCHHEHNNRHRDVRTEVEDTVVNLGKIKV